MGFAGYSLRARPANTNRKHSDNAHLCGITHNNGTFALDQAALLQNWDLPEDFEHLRRLLEGWMGKKGRKEYIQVLRLLGTFGDVEVAAPPSVHGSGASGKPGSRMLRRSRSIRSNSHRRSK